MIQRRTPLKRSTKPLKRTAVNKRRAGKPRRGPAIVPIDEWRNPGYLKFLKTHGQCLLCPFSVMHLQRCEPCHGPTNGTASKGPDAQAVPLCRMHHSEQHKIGWKAFEEAHRFNRIDEARLWWQAYKETV